MARGVEISCARCKRAPGAKKCTFRLFLLVLSWMELFQQLVFLWSVGLFSWGGITPLALPCSLGPPCDEGDLFHPRGPRLKRSCLRASHPLYVVLRRMRQWDLFASSPRVTMPRSTSASPRNSTDPVGTSGREAVRKGKSDTGTGQVGLVTCPTPRELIQVQVGCSKGEQVEFERSTRETTSLLTSSAHPSPALHGLK